MITHEQYSRQDLRLASFLTRLDGNESHFLERVIRLLSFDTRNGNVCLDLNHLPERLEMDVSELEVLGERKIVGEGEELTPLVLRDSRLYLYRYYKYERELVERLRRLLEGEGPGRPQNLKTLKPLLERLFPHSPEVGQLPARFDPDRSGDIIQDRQLKAALLALYRSLIVVSGGPGTGKTTTVVRMLALHLAQNPGLKIMIAAPTGKAALRLQESINRARSGLDIPEELRGLIPEEVSTLHRLLGPRTFSPYFNHNAENPLPCDLLVVDEASMVDLPLFSKTLAALRKSAGVILLGDPHQLASVEAGSVLGDICQAALDADVPTAPGVEIDVAGIPETDRYGNYDLFTGGGGPKLETKALKKSSVRVAPQITQAVITLNKNYRFGDDSSIARLANDINSGNAASALELLSRSSDKSLRFIEVKSSQGDAPENEQDDFIGRNLAENVVRFYGDFARARDPESCLDAFDSYRLLCAHRQGLRGTLRINEFITAVLVKENLLRVLPGFRRFDPLPILINKNDYRLGLYNGDTGVLIHDERRRPVVYFRGAEGELRVFHRTSLPEHEISFAMTVHKSQGSEFTHTALLLPESTSGILTRELLYTAVTRSRKSFTLFGDREVFSEGVAATIERASGLKAALSVRQ